MAQLFHQDLLLYSSQRKTSVDGERVNSLFYFFFLSDFITVVRTFIEVSEESITG